MVVYSPPLWMYLCMHAQEKELKDERVLEMISTFLATGELPILFSNDEEDGLLQVSGKPPWVGQ